MYSEQRQQATTISIPNGLDIQSVSTPFLNAATVGQGLFGRRRLDLAKAISAPTPHGPLGGATTTIPSSDDFNQCPERFDADSDAPYRLTKRAAPLAWASPSMQTSSRTSSSIAAKCPAAIYWNVTLLYPHSRKTTADCSAISCQTCVPGQARRSKWYYRPVLPAIESFDSHIAAWTPVWCWYNILPSRCTVTWPSRVLH